VFQGLPEYPWQKLKPYRESAARYKDGAIDLSVGNPIDPTPQIIQSALDSASDSPGYPTAWGDVQARQAVADWYARRRKSPGLFADQILLTIGSKEFISWLPIMLGIRAGEIVVQPRLAYTAYKVGAAFAGAEIFVGDEPDEWPESTKLIWLNSPGNPNGSVHSVEFLKRALDRARELGAVIVNDECYAEMGWTAPWDDYIPCMLDPKVTGGDLTNVLSIYSLSKQSNLAGYRAAFAAGDERPWSPPWATTCTLQHKKRSTGSAGRFYCQHSWATVSKFMTPRRAFICGQPRVNTAGTLLPNSLSWALWLYPENFTESRARTTFVFQ
jgi:aspartate/methionine/tyrosine aminotransferase